MQITKVKTWQEDLELTKPYSIAFRTISSVENLFVLLETSNGDYGIGAGSPAEFVTGEKITDSLKHLNDHLEQCLLKKDIRQLPALLKSVEHSFSNFPAARAAIDIALFDLFSKTLNQPLVDFLGRSHPNGMLTSITIGIKALEETLEEALMNIKSGFQIIKLKTGKSVEADVETFSKLREKVGKNIVIRVDANQGYSVEDLIEFAQKTQHLNVEFFEQPFPPHQLDKMKKLPIDLAKQCAADEDLHLPSDAMHLSIPDQLYGIYNIKLMKCGGINPALKIADIAHWNQIDLMWGCNDESIISITAALHAALAAPATKYLDLDGSLDLARDIVDGGFILKDGKLFTNGEPGLGVRLK